MTDRQDSSRAPAKRGRRNARQPAGREALIRAATRCFADYGFEAAGVRMIAARAKTAPNLVTVHFGGKDGLWAACVESLAAELEPRMEALSKLSNDQDVPLRDRLSTAIAMTARYYEDNPDLRGFIARGGMEPAPRGPEIAERLLKPLYAAASPLIQQAIDIDPSACFTMSDEPLLMEWRSMGTG